MTFSPRCRTKKLGIIYTILGSFYSFLNWEGANIRPNSGLGQSLIYIKFEEKKLVCGENKPTDIQDHVSYILCIFFITQQHIA